MSDLGKYPTLTEQDNLIVLFAIVSMIVLCVSCFLVYEAVV
jgi:hypothetical protein